jgi:hypothetical protein
VPGVANVHFPSQPVFGDAGATGTADSHVGAAPVQAMFAAVLLSAKVTEPPLAIVTFEAGWLDPEVAQHGQSGSTQFSLTSSFDSDGVAARAGSTATVAPTIAARAKSKSVRGLILNPPFSCWISYMARRVNSSRLPPAKILPAAFRLRCGYPSGATVAGRHRPSRLFITPNAHTRPALPD